MIVFPKNWKKDYSTYSKIDCIDIDSKKIIKFILNNLKNTLKKINVNNLAYSGGIDSTIILSLMSKIHKHVNTFTISSRQNHPDILHARIGANKYKSNHKEFIVTPIKKGTDTSKGDTAVRMLFEMCNVDKIICCDGIDEFMGGYYSHQKDPKKYYKQHLTELLPNHLIPLNKNSQKIQVYLPYLNNKLINFLSQIDINKKINIKERKKIIYELGKEIKIPASIMWRNKYGFSEAFRENNK
jgi:asparagine synthetase B (glutamine-hydrolysing)